VPRSANATTYCAFYDMKSPASSLLGLAQLQREPARALPAGELSQRLDLLAQRLLTLVEGFVWLARAESSDPFAFEDFDLRNAVQDAYDEVWALAQVRNTSIAASVPRGFAALARRSSMAGARHRQLAEQRGEVFRRPDQHSVPARIRRPEPASGSATAAADCIAAPLIRAAPASASLRTRCEGRARRQSRRGEQPTAGSELLRVLAAHRCYGIAGMSRMRVISDGTPKRFGGPQ
jgi:hypothetical protein